jgi:hypothetical protein
MNARSLNRHPQPNENTQKDSPKSIVPWCLGHKKAPHEMQAYDFTERKCGEPLGSRTPFQERILSTVDMKGQHIGYAVD